MQDVGAGKGPAYLTYYVDPRGFDSGKLRQRAETTNSRLLRLKQHAIRFSPSLDLYAMTESYD